MEELQGFLERIEPARLARFKQTCQGQAGARAFGTPGAAADLPQHHQRAEAALGIDVRIELHLRGNLAPFRSQSEHGKIVKATMGAYDLDPEQIEQEAAACAEQQCTMKMP